MVERGSYAKGVAKRAEILETAVDIVGRNGFSGATVRELADAVGLSPNGLLHYFGSKDELFTEILRRRDELDSLRFPAETDPGLQFAALVRAVEHNAEVPGLVQLYARISNEAAQEVHPSHDYFKQRYADVREAFTETFRRLEATGVLAEQVNPRLLSTLLLAVLDGLQTQWMYDPSIDMAEHVAHLLAIFGLPAQSTKL